MNTESEGRREKAKRTSFLLLPERNFVLVEFLLSFLGCLERLCFAA